MARENGVARMARALGRSEVLARFAAVSFQFVKECWWVEDRQLREAMTEFLAFWSVSLHEVSQVSFVPSHQILGRCSDGEIGAMFIFRIARQRECLRRLGNVERHSTSGINESLDALLSQS